MTEEQIERLITALERIACALEVANIPPAPPTPAPPTTWHQGYCALHGYYLGSVSPGCNSAIRTYPYGSYTVCATPHCYLKSDHPGPHQFAVVWNTNG